MRFQKGQKIITQPYLCNIPKYGIKDTDREIGEVIEANEKSITVKWFDRQLNKYVELNYDHNECGDFSLADKDDEVGIKVFNLTAKCEQAHVSSTWHGLVCPHCGEQTNIDPAELTDESPMPYCPECDEALIVNEHDEE